MKITFDRIISARKDPNTYNPTQNFPQHYIIETTNPAATFINHVFITDPYNPAKQ